VQQRVDGLTPRPLIGDPLEHGEVLEQSLGGDVGVDAEFLRQVAERFADFVFLLDHVQVAELDRALVWVLERGDRPHQGGLAGAVGAEQAVHALRDGEATCLRARIPLRYVLETFQISSCIPSRMEGQSAGLVPTELMGARSVRVRRARRDIRGSSPIVPPSLVV